MRMAMKDRRENHERWTPPSLLAVLALAVLSLGLAACGGDEEQTAGSGQAAPSPSDEPPVPQTAQAPPPEEECVLIDSVSSERTWFTAKDIKWEGLDGCEEAKEVVKEMQYEFFVAYESHPDGIEAVINEIEAGAGKCVRAKVESHANLGYGDWTCTSGDKKVSFTGSPGEVVLSGGG